MDHKIRRLHGFDVELRSREHTVSVSKCATENPMPGPDRWVPKSTNISAAAATAGASGGEQKQEKVEAEFLHKGRGIAAGPTA